MAINQILQFGAGAGANVMTPADYSALAARSSGFQSGVAKSKEVNTPMRQSAFVAAMIGQFIANTAGIDVLDDGDLSGLEEDFKASLKGLLPGRLMTSKTFISSGTYTPTPGTRFARFKGVAAGGGSGGTLATGAGQAAASGAGSAGNHFDFFVMQGLTSMSITIGAAGAAGSSAPGNGGDGGDIVIGSIATIKGGRGGLAGNAHGTFPGLSGACQANAVSTISSVGTFGVLNGLGQTGVRGVVLGIVNILYSSGGNSAWGRGGTLDGAGAGIGGGGVGSGVGQNTPAGPGFPGGAGILVVEEYA